MNPVIKHLQSMFPELPLAVESQSMPWTFNEDIKKLGPDFFSKVMLLHPVLTIEYSVLCYNLKHSLAIQSKVNNPALIEQLKAALILAELLEHVHLRYLVVPREVARLRGHQQTYRELLRDIAGYEFSPHLPGVGSVDVGLSITQRIRDEIAEYNWYRLLFTRSKRMLDLLDVVVTNSKQYHNFVTFMDKYTNTFFAYLGWVFFIPRLSVNSILLLKHTLPWPWMDDDEKAIAWYVRFMAHLQRRWFELGNDLVWITAGLLNCFVFVGALAPFGFYVTLAAFAFDVINTSVRAYIELSRLYTLQKEYTAMLQQTNDEEEQKAIREHMYALAHRINFEQWRLGLTVISATGIFIGMSLALPLLALHPVAPFIGAALIIAIWIVSFTLTRVIEQHRPNDRVEKPQNLSKLGFFAQKNMQYPATSLVRENIEEVEPLSNDVLCF